MSKNIHQAVMIVAFYFGTREYNWMTLKKKYLIQNWNDEDHLRQLVDEIAQELHYLSGYGIESIKIDAPHLKFTTLYDIQYTPYWEDSNCLFSDAIRFEVGSTQAHPSRTIWFDIPRAMKETPNKPSLFFALTIGTTYKGSDKRRTQTKYHLMYEQNDPQLLSFLHKICEKGVLRPYMKTLNEIRWNTVASIRHISWWHLPESQITEHQWKQNEKNARQEEREKNRLARAGIVYKDPKKKVKANQVYLIEMIGEGGIPLYKIGMSATPGKRLRALKTSSPFELKVIHQFTAEPAEDAEAQLHAKYRQSHVSGEWFRLTLEQIRELQQISAYKNGTFFTQKNEK